MFWGLIMEPQRRYTQKVRKPFHISMAALDVAFGSDEPAQVMCGNKGRTYLLCTLKPSGPLQCALDLTFEEGNEISFATNGKCNVHLTGYLLEESSEELEEVEKEKKSSKKKRNADQINGLSSMSSAQPKKSKVESSDFDFKSELLGASMDEDDDDESFTLEDSQIESDTDEVDDSEEKDVDEEEDDEDDDEEEEEEDEEDDDEEGEEDEQVEEDENDAVDNENDEGSSLSEDELPEDIRKLNALKKSKQVEENGVVPKKKKSAKVQDKETKSNQIHKKEVSLQGGVIIEDIKEGQGPPAKNGKFVTVYYEGRLKQNNKVFDAASKGSGFRFRLGAGEVIKGWDVGVVGMKVGGKRRITCPPAMAYGVKGSPPAIPGNSTLVFEVELKKVR